MLEVGMVEGLLGVLSRIDVSVYSVTVLREVGTRRFLVEGQRKRRGVVSAGLGVAFALT